MMSPFLKCALPLLVLLALLTPMGIFFLSRSVPVSATATETTPPPPPALSVLAEMPDWTLLEAFQNTVTRDDFERLFFDVFTADDAWLEFIEIDETEARIRTGGTDEDPGFFHLRFASSETTPRTPRIWKSTADLPPAPSGKPLAGLHIAIDPGHIGGSWAKLEERWLLIGNGTPVCEGDMTLQVAQLLKPRLEAQGARVSLVREKPEPITLLRPESLLTVARAAEPDASPAALQKLAERLFYRTAEIRARANLVNETLKPDLVLCLHFNADPWGDPNQPTLVNRTHLHLLLNGAYTGDEVALADQRFSLLYKILSGTHDEEALVGATVADTFAEMSGLPPFIYPANSPNARPVNGHPYLWARNLLANRLYDCPVLFIEPYVMNSTIDYPRLQAGDYEGLREIDGKQQVSVFREYADSLARGLARHYSKHRSSVASRNGRIEVKRGDSLVFAWQGEPLPDPAGGPKFAASAFLHPLCTPSGFQCTTIQPPDHPHHFGIWWPWKFIEVEGKRYNCWEIQEGQAALVARSAVQVTGSPDQDQWEFHNAVEIRTPDNPPKTVIDETTTLSLAGTGTSGNVFDLTLRQKATGSAVKILNHRYSGFTWRGPASWDKDNSHLVTSEGHGRDEADGKPARWVVVSGPTPEGSASVLLMSAASTVAGAPEHLRVWDSNAHNGAPFVNFNPVSEIPLPLDDAHPAVSSRRYRVIAADRVIDSAAAEAEWRKWLEK